MKKRSKNRQKMPHHHGMANLGIFKPTVGKLTLALVLMVILFLLLIIDLPENVYQAILMIIAWPLFFVAGQCGVETECLQPASFIGVLLMVFYWYVTASLLEGIFGAKSK
ncbi:hypothetical protein KJ765_01100 [Candidatus Micrarchaeota archaeon]|nr:hypothetical protein [Candidatus Micrarchaeota archaeon]